MPDPSSDPAPHPDAAHPITSASAPTMGPKRNVRAPETRALASRTCFPLSRTITFIGVRSARLVTETRESGGNDFLTTPRRSRQVTRVPRASRQVLSRRACCASLPAVTRAGSGGSAGHGGASGTGGTAGASATGTAGNGPNGGRGGSAGTGASTGTGGVAGTGGAIATGSIFVAPSGDDANPGTMAQPLKTTAKARDVVRGMTAGMTADITVYLRGGTYQQTSTLTFANADSGKNGFYVKYVAYRNEQPNSQMQYNYLHDDQTTTWADYGSQGIYLDEQTSGYTIAHNAMVNAPANVAQNQTGQNTITDTPASNPSSGKTMAGVETAYADIKNLTIPVPSF
jgi:hypothetical protein